MDAEAFWKMYEEQLFATRGPTCKLGSQRVFKLILWILSTGMEWKRLPASPGPKDPDGKAEIPSTTVYNVFAR